MDAPIRSVEALPTRRLQTHIIEATGLPVLLGYDVLGVWLSRGFWVMYRGWDGASWDGQGRGIFVGFEHIQTFQFLVQHGKGLESLRLVHLGFEPVLHFVLSIVLQVLMYVIEVSVLLTRALRKRSVVEVPIQL